MITLVCYTCAFIAVCVNVCTPRRAGGSPVHASWELSCNLQYNAIGQFTLVVAVCLQEDSCQIVSRLPGKHSLPSSTPTHHPAELSLCLSSSLKDNSGCHWMGAEVLQRRDGQAGGDWQVKESSGEYREFTHNEACQFECLKAKQHTITADNWGGHFISEKRFQGNFLPLTLTRL